jgi:hypothetical protein
MDVTKTGMGNGKLKWEIENGKFFRLIVDNADTFFSERKLNFFFIFYTPHFLHSSFSTLRTFYTPHFLHSAFSTLRIFYTPHFPHSALSTLRTIYTPHFLHSAFSTLRTLRIPPNLDFSEPTPLKQHSKLQFHNSEQI